MKKTDDFPYSSLKNGRDINRSVGAYSKMISYDLIPKTWIFYLWVIVNVVLNLKLLWLLFKYVNRSSSLLELIHIYVCICDNKEILTRWGKIYFITFIDDLSKFTYVYLLRIKDEAFEKFKIFKDEIENNTNKKIKVLRFNELVPISISSVAPSPSVSIPLSSRPLSHRPFILRKLRIEASVYMWLYLFYHHLRDDMIHAFSFNTLFLDVHMRYTIL